MNLRYGIETFLGAFPIDTKGKTPYTLTRVKGFYGFTCLFYNRQVRLHNHGSVNGRSQDWIEKGGNKKFIKNIVSWLLEEH